MKIPLRFKGKIYKTVNRLAIHVHKRNVVEIKILNGYDSTEIKGQDLQNCD